MEEVTDSTDSEPCQMVCVRRPNPLDGGDAVLQGSGVCHLVVEEGGDKGG